MSNLSTIARCYAATVGSDLYISEKEVRTRLNSSISRQQTNMLDDSCSFRSKRDIYEQTLSAEYKQRPRQIPLKKLQGKRFATLT